MTADPLQLLAGLLPGRPGVDGYFPVMSLATVDDLGRPDVRTVLLSEIVDSGLAFHTDAGSRKVRHVHDRPVVALLLALPEQARQIVVQGPAVAAGPEELRAAYRARSRYLQLLAWLNTAEMAVLPDTERRARWAEFGAAHPEGSLDPPPGWTGFVVVPQRVTFWLGDADGPSNRTEYTRTATGWAEATLPG